MAQFELLEKAQQNIEDHNRKINRLENEIDALRKIEVEPNSSTIYDRGFKTLKSIMSEQKFILEQKFKEEIKDHENAIHNIKLQFS